MKNAIMRMSKVCFWVPTLAVVALGQNWVQVEPAPAATAPAYSVSVGYTTLVMAMPGAGHVNLGGLDASGRVEVNSRWGAMLDTNYLRASNVLATPHDGSVLSFYTGPVFYPVNHGKIQLSLHLLGGVSRVNGALPENDTAYRHGWLAHFSYAAGGEIEYPVSAPFGVRVGGDYLRTAFFDSTGTVQPQNNLRLTAGFVFHLNARQR